MHALIADIYEAALLGDKWHNVFDALCNRYQSAGAMIFAWNGNNTTFLATENMTNMVMTTAAAGMAEHNIRAPRLLALNYSGFLSDLDVVSLEEVSQNRLYQEFLIPGGLHASAGTHIQGIGDDNLVFSLDGFADFEAARAAVPLLDPLRGHLARALSISSRLSLERAKAVTQALEAIGIPTAVIGYSGKLFAANSLFEPLLGKTIYDHANSLRLSDSKANALLTTSLERIKTDPSKGISIPIAPDGDQRTRVLHLMPIVGEARDLFSPDMLLLTLAGGQKSKDLQAPLLKVLYDLTPAEARIAQGLSSGQSASQIAASDGKSVQTVRFQIKSILAKTGQSTQKELIVMLRDLHH